MTRVYAIPLLLLVAAACDDAVVQDRLSVALANGEPVVRIDLDPLSVTSEVDNNVDVEVTFEVDPVYDDIVASTNFTQYQIEYRIGEEFAPPIAGEIDFSVSVGATNVATLRGATELQLEWIADRYTGDEMDVWSRVSLGGIYDADTAVLTTTEYLTTFADYR